MGNQDPQYKLVVCDMDGTLLDSEHHIPEGFWALLDRLTSQSVAFAPASGRQLYTLLNQFEQASYPVSVIAENGTMVYHEGEIISTTTIAPEDAHRIIDIVDAHPEIDWGLALCRTDGAFVSRTDEDFLAEGTRYYARLTHIEDLHQAVNDDVVKLALYSFEDVEDRAHDLFSALPDHLAVAVSGKHWIDVMNKSANKGKALRELADAMGIDISQTLAFGDYLNDYELIEAAGTSYVMDNGHQKLKDIADHIAPPNSEHGVLTVLDELFPDSDK
ncbi:Cof-type HAD-IIB family hydrolase [Corynebacterium sp. ES2794-CONJ1]|uniref:HAD family hydrolase n=1 Tax=unclassified Corynebacterium TaxID=2624378 RepID=UPI002168670D|nr:MULTISPECIES: HAD family hydrolase [unclassified Corynebacterium]MCS4489982.1 Cof-type HAD-IIB family hydrolase [Corynebacterium sp. ES2775-CONJ]MCS4491655.1 Cof-type HAD-IIB family hydrolase [Corynebacterium sp. ES2715-CONJ3]MCS4531760.1 Cof-type HAD-IIB family hydrolase [Corynebacterium sp. ES2730-CONJ]MCU9519156.1 Cof-type HAD-IIB family hydrolase [Corynebacterium sp. ES2794-CONJ1]